MSNQSIRENPSPKDVIDAILPVLKDNDIALVMGHAKSRNGCPYLHTLGLYKFNHPEIIIAGFNPESITPLLHDVISQIVNGNEKFLGDSTYELVDSNHCVFREPFGFTRKEDVLDVANAYFGDVGFQMVQMFIPDDLGLLPWDEGCDPIYADSQYELFDLSNKPKTRPH